MLTASLIGNLGSDPELKAVSSGSILRMNVAVNQRQRIDGEWTEKTEWVRCTVFGNRAESLANHLRKGMRVYVSGRLEARPWTSNQGEIRAGLELVANDVEFMSSRQDDDAPRQQPARQAERASSVLPDTDESLPF